MLYSPGFHGEAKTLLPASLTESIIYQLQAPVLWDKAGFQLSRSEDNLQQRFQNVFAQPGATRSKKGSPAGRGGLGWSNPCNVKRRLSEEGERGKGSVHTPRLCTYITFPLQRSTAWIFIIPTSQGWNQGRNWGISQDQMGAAVKERSRYKSYRVMPLLSPVFQWERRVPPCNCFSNTAKDIELGVQEEEGAAKGRQA